MVRWAGTSRWSLSESDMVASGGGGLGDGRVVCRKKVDGERLDVVRLLGGISSLKEETGKEKTGESSSSRDEWRRWKGSKVGRSKERKKAERMQCGETREHTGRREKRGKDRKQGYPTLGSDRERDRVMEFMTAVWPDVQTFTSGGNLNLV